MIDTAKAYPGMSADTRKKGLLARVQAKDATANVSQVAGVGDVAIFAVEARSFSATVDAVLGAKGFQVSVKYHAGDSAASKDKIAALAKAAASRL